jgi:hypothetical protein
MYGKTIDENHGSSLVPPLCIVKICMHTVKVWKKVIDPRDNLPNALIFRGTLICYGSAGGLFLSAVTRASRSACTTVNAWEEGDLTRDPHSVFPIAGKKLCVML